MLELKQIKKSLKKTAAVKDKTVPRKMFPYLAWDKLNKIGGQVSQVQV